MGLEKCIIKNLIERGESMYKILVIDDDEQMLDFIKDILENEGHQVKTSSKPEDFLLYDELNNYDLIILDVMMPGIDGFTFYSEVREVVNTPVIFLSAADAENSMIKGLNLGAEDYLTKPFSNKLLLAKIKNILTRRGKSISNKYKTHGMVVDIMDRTVSIEDRALDLSRTEFEIIAILSRQMDKVFTHEELHHRILEFDAESELRVITQYIYQVRKKLKHYGKFPIKSVWGVGYKWIKD